MKGVLRYWKTILVTGIILYVCLLRKSHLALPSVAYADKWAHALMYLLLSAVAWWDSAQAKVDGWWRILVAIILPIIYGGIIELLQEQWLYPRTGDWADWIADGIGAILGYGMMMLINRIKKAKDDARMAK